MSLRIAEIDQHPVAKIFGHKMRASGIGSTLKGVGLMIIIFCQLVVQDR